MSNTKWQTLQGDISKAGFFDLFHNRVAYIAVEHFLTPTQCATLAAALVKMGLQQYDYNFDVNDDLPPNIYLIPIIYMSRNPQNIFPAAERAINEYKKFCQITKLDPVALMAEFLAKQLEQPVKIAEQDGNYTYAIARQLNKSALLHADFASFIPS